MAKVMDDWIDEKQGDRIAAELEARQEAFDARVESIMQDHKKFSEFIEFSCGEDWLSELLEEFAAGHDRDLPLMYGQYREFCETLIKERG